MTVNIALFLSSDSIALAHRQPAGHWAMVGETGLDVADLGAAMGDLHGMAVEREGAEFSALLVLPDDQILYTSLTAPTGDDELTAFRIEEGLDGLTPYAITELEYDWREVEQDRVKIAVVARETLEEARGFASGYGFTTAGFVAMPPTERFPGLPVFDLDAGATAALAGGLPFGPDVFGMPEPEPEPEPVAEPDLAEDAMPEDAAEDTVASVDEASEDASEDNSVTDDVAENAAKEVADEPPLPEEADAPPVPRETDAPDVTESDPDPVAAAPTSPVAEETDDTQSTPQTDDVAETEDAPDPDANAALAEALAISAAADPAPQTEIADPALSAPIAPVDDPTEGLDDPSLPPAPSPASAEAKKRARALRGDKAPVAERGTKSLAAQRPDRDSGSLVGQRNARLDLSAGDASPTPQAPEPKTDADADSAGLPKLAERLHRVRDASKTRPKPAPSITPPPQRARVEITPRPGDAETGLTAERRPSPFDAPPEEANDAGRGGLMGMLGLRRGDGATAPASQDVAARNMASPDDAAMAASAPGEAGAATADEGTFTSGLLARKTVASNGPSFKTGLILTVILLILLALVAIWSAVALPNSPIARLFGLSPDQQTAAAPQLAPNAPDVTASVSGFGTVGDADPSLEDEAAADGIDVVEVLPTDAEPAIEVAAVIPEAQPTDPASVEPALPDIDADLDLPPLAPLAQDMLPSVEEAETIYAQDGIWARTPDRPDLRPFDLLDRVYTAAIDPDIAALDAVALPDPQVNFGEALRQFPDPPAFGTEFSLTDRGLIAATPDGVLTPEGAFVIQGAPSIAAVPRPREIVSDAPAIDVDSTLLSLFRPTPRPSDLSQIRERQVLGGLTSEELSTRRPELRPLSPQEAAARASLFPGGTDDTTGDAVTGDETAPPATGGTELAIARSLLPQTRPGNIAQIVASADRRPAQPETAVVAAAVAPGPAIPSNADVARAATERNAIRLRDVNLIGVVGTASDRRALVRLPSGRFVRVGVGDRLDGGRVAAIGESTLQYLRNGRTLTLEVAG